MKSESYLQVKYFKENLAYNNSFKLLGYYFSQMDSLPGLLGSAVYENYLFFAGIFSILLCLLVIQRNVSNLEAILLIAIGSSMVIPIAGGYSLIAFMMPLAVILSEKNFLFRRLDVFYCCCIGLILMPKQFAIGFSELGNTTFTYGGILNPGLSLMIVCFIFFRSLTLRRREDPSDLGTIIFTRRLRGVSRNVRYNG